MKKKRNISLKILNATLIVCIVLLFIAVIAYVIPGIAQPYIVMQNGTIIEDNKVYFCDSGNSCGNIRVGIDLWKQEFLDENFQCISIDCNIHYNYSQRAKINTLNTSRTWDGPIEYIKDGGVIFYEKEAGIVQECSPCKEYQYNNYTIIRK